MLSLVTQNTPREVTYEWGSFLRNSSRRELYLILVITLNEKEPENEYMCMHDWGTMLYARN